MVRSTKTAAHPSEYTTDTTAHATASEPDAIRTRKKVTASTALSSIIQNKPKVAWWPVGAVSFHYLQILAKFYRDPPVSSFLAIAPHSRYVGAHQDVSHLNDGDGAFLMLACGPEFDVQ